MDSKLPGLILTGASGFVGRNFIKAATGKFRLFCIARRSMEEAGVQPDANLRWLQVDIADRAKLLGFAERMRGSGGVDYVISLAGYYDFTNQNHPEYMRTNVHGTGNVLELAKMLEVKRFLFASSQAACPFGTLVTEETPPTAGIPYARSKRAGEELLHQYSQWFPCAIIRIAAVFSDWCEYPPLYTMLNNWLSGKFFESRVLAGQGKSAIPYIHVQDLAQMLMRVIDKSDELDRVCVLNAGPDGAVSHLDLYRIATQYFYNKAIQPLFVPPSVLYPMVMAKRVLAHLAGTEAFEQLWMLKYVDQQLIADSSRTRKQLAWKPTPRKSITRRLVFLIENMERNPELWRNWNEAMLQKKSNHPQLALHEMLCEALENEREAAIEAITSQLLNRDAVVQAMTEQEVVESSQIDTSCIRALQSMDKKVAYSFLRLLFQLIATVMRTANRPMMQQYAHTIAFLPMFTGFGSGLVSRSLFIIGEFLIQRFRERPAFKKVTPQAGHYITMAIHMAVDRIEDQAEMSRLQSPVKVDGFRTMPLPESEKLELVVRQLEDLCRETVSGTSWTSPLVQG